MVKVFYTLDQMVEPLVNQIDRDVAFLRDFSGGRGMEMSDEALLEQEIEAYRNSVRAADPRPAAGESFERQVWRDVVA
jgi:hypothetical protein